MLTDALPPKLIIRPSAFRSKLKPGEPGSPPEDHNKLLLLRRKGSCEACESAILFVSRERQSRELKAHARRSAFSRTSSLWFTKLVGLKLARNKLERLLAGYPLQNVNHLKVNLSKLKLTLSSVHRRLGKDKTI